LLGRATVQRVIHENEPTVVAATASESLPLTALPKTTSHVLIADANARTLAARAEQLLAAGLRVSLAHTSFEAIVKASCHVPDFILLDGSLADLDAAATGQLLTTCPMTAHIPIFKLTPGRRVPQRVVTAALRHSP
jgi:CheY-like chemotaxis protein